MTEQFEVKILSPGKPAQEHQSSRVSVYAQDGFLEIYPDHGPIVFLLGNGPCEIFQDEDSHKLAVHGGFAHLIHNKLTLFPHYFEAPEDVDLQRAQEALRRSNLRLTGKDPELSKRSTQMGRLYASRERAILRLRLKGVSVDE
jgi:F-type H+-transporting ATPase subunit epsilon